MKTFRWKHSPQLALTLKGLTETERKGGGGREGEGTGGSCWVSADGLTQFQGTQWSQRLISKRQIVILVSSMAPVWWVHLLCSCAVGVLGGGGWNQRRGPHYVGAPWWGRIESETVMCLKCIEMKIGQALTAAFGVHSYKHSIGFDQIEGAHRWGSSELTETMMLLPRWQTKNPLSPGNTATSPWALDPRPTTLPYTPAHAPILHLNYFLILHTMSGSSCSAPITKLSAQIKDEAHLTAAKHFNKHTNMRTVLCKQNM